MDIVILKDAGVSARKELEARRASKSKYNFFLNLNHFL
jgi:hypothetical protein